VNAASAAVRFPADDGIKSLVPARRRKAGAKPVACTSTLKKAVGVQSRTPTERRDWKSEKIAARKSLLIIYVQFKGLQGRNGISARKALGTFCRLYNNRLLDDVTDWAYATIPHICPRTVTYWRKARFENGDAGLTPKWGLHRRGKGILASDAKQRALIFKMARDLGPYVTAKQLVETLLKHFVPNEVPSERTMRRFLHAWRSEGQIRQRPKPKYWQYWHQSAADEREKNERLAKMAYADAVLEKAGIDHDFGYQGTA